MELTNEEKEYLADRDRPLKENIFEISCRNCRYMANAKDFIASADSNGTEFGYAYKYVTLKCPHCGATETINVAVVI